MSNPRPKEDPDPYQARQRYDIVCRVFSGPGNEIGRLNYVRHGMSDVGTLVSHLLYVNAAFHHVEIFVTNRPHKPEPRTDPLEIV